MDLVRKDSLLGNKKVIVGDKYTDLVLETLGKIYVKTGNKSQLLDQLISTLIQNADKPKTILVNSESEMNTMKYPGDGAFIYNKLTDSLYMALDNRYVLIVQVQTDDAPQYVNKDGDSMSGPLEIITVSAPLIVYSSELVKNLNAEYLNSYSSDDFAKKKIDEVIYGSWSFDSPCYANNNWIFKENTRFYKDIVTSGSISSPQFAGGFGGYGWMIDANTNTLTIDNIVVRKAMQVYEMVINQISATNGSMWVTNSVKVKEAYRPYIITKEELDDINTGTKEEITAKLNGVLWNNSYFLITDLNLTINQDTNNLGVSEEENIGIVTETKSLSSANNINIVPKEFVNFKYIIWIGDLNKVLEDENFPGVSAFYDENYLFNVNTNLDLKAYYLSKEIQVTEWNEDNTPKVSNYLNTFNKGSEIFIKSRDSFEVVGLKPYYKYFALSRDQINSALAQHVNDGIKKVPVPTIYIIDTDDSTDPTLKSGDIIRCQKYEDNNIKYYDAIVTAHFKSKGYILQKAASVFDTYTEVNYSDTGEVESRTEVDNSTLYNKTDYTYNPETGEYQYNYPTTEKVADIATNDDLIQMGNIYNTQRQNAIYITSTDDQGPYIDIMSGLNRPDYSVIYDQPVYKKIKVFVKQKGDIFVQGEPSDYYYQKENPQAINFNQKPAYISGNTKKYPLIYITVNTDLNVTGTYINNGETNNIPEDTSQGYFITNYPTQYSAKEDKVVGTKITKVRLGNLDGIYNEIFGNKQPYGFGLYGENVFLTGEFYLNNGKSVVDFSTDQIFLKFGEAGLKIAEDENGKSYIQLTADLTKITTSKGKDIAMFTVDDEGNPYLAADLIKADTIQAKTIKNQSDDGKTIYYELKEDGSGQLAQNNINWDKFGLLNINRITASSGDIGGFKINSNSLTAGSDYGSYMQLSTTKISFTNDTSDYKKMLSFGVVGPGVFPGSSGLQIPVGIYSKSKKTYFENVGMYINCEGAKRYTNNSDLTGNIALYIKNGIIRGLKLPVETLESGKDINTDYTIHMAMGDVYLPTTANEGELAIIAKAGGNDLNVRCTESKIWFMGDWKSSVFLNWGHLAIFVYTESYKKDGVPGVWFCCSSTHK